MIIAGKEQ